MRQGGAVKIENRRVYPTGEIEIRRFGPERTRTDTLLAFEHQRDVGDQADVEARTSGGHTVPDGPGTVGEKRASDAVLRRERSGLLVQHGSRAAAA
jgi:hypothetical protein